MSKPTPVSKPIPGKVIRREVTENYTLIEEEPAGFNTVGFEYLETKCAGKCDRPYRVDTLHPGYAETKAALDRGDRSSIFCYHKSRI